MRSENKSDILAHTNISAADVKTVTAAYTSQTCPIPLGGDGYVSAANRQRDKFYCRHCGWQVDAGHVAAVNLLDRLGDQEISIFTNQTLVKKMLEDRFRRRRESEKLPLTAGLQADYPVWEVGDHKVAESLESRLNGKRPGGDLSGWGA